MTNKYDPIKARDRRYKHAYDHGKQCAERGYDRNSFYVGGPAEEYWYKGFDSVAKDKEELKND